MVKAKPEPSVSPDPSPVLPHIHTVRKQRVVLDADIAKLYEVPTFRINEAIKRNAARFPAACRLRLTREEAPSLKSQISTTSSGHRDARKPPTAFTRHRCLMATTILRSEKAVQMNLYLVRAFVQIREPISADLGVLRRRAELDKKLPEHDSVLREVVERLSPLLNSAPEDDAQKPKIGYHRGNR